MTSLPKTSPHTAGLRRPGLACLLVLYVLAVSLVHDPASLALGALVVGLGLFRALLIVRLTRSSRA